MSQSILVVSSAFRTRRQVSRALSSAGRVLRFVDEATDLPTVYARERPALLVVDVDSINDTSIESLMRPLEEAPGPVPMVLVGANPATMSHLLQRYDMHNLVAKHGAVGAVHPLLDERELLVTCQKVLTQDIFGLEKYVGMWGVTVYRVQLQAMRDRYQAVNQFEGFLKELACPNQVVSDILTVADELMLNAIVHAPRGPDGGPKYEHLEPDPALVLQPHEQVDVAYACDGQRLMFSVSDNFGSLRKQTVQEYVVKSLDSHLQTIELKPSGAGLGLSMAFRRIHQMVFNIHEKVRTEVMAGWWLRADTANEFRRVSKSLNMFWRPQHGQPVPQRRPSNEPLTGS